MEYILRTFDLCKKYKHKPVLNCVNMNIRRGDIYGFVGENGSGKTTVIRLITGLIFPTSGSYELFGVSSVSGDLTKIRRKVGAIVESPSIYLNFTAKENIEFQCDLLGLEKTEDIVKGLLKEVGLGDLYDSPKKAGDFSLGMRQRLGIAMTLVGDPEFLILDEPLNGLDPAGIVEIRELILKLNQEKKITFLISSHLLSELSLVANTYGMISKGHIVKEISVDELSKECRPYVEVTTDDPAKLYYTLKTTYPCEIKALPYGMIIYHDGHLNEILEDILKTGVKIEALKTSNVNIEEYYLSVVGGVRYE